MTAPKRTRIPKQPGRPIPRRSVGPAVATFARKRMRHHKGPTYARPFVLEPWQSNPDLTGDLDLIYEVDERGRRVWRSVLYGIARGNGKSPMAALVGLTELLSRRDSPEIICAAGSRDQARHVYEPAQWNVDNGPLAKYLVAHRNVIKPRWRDGKMQVVSADGALMHGGSVSVGIVDELHVFTTAKQEELVAAIDSSLHKRPDSFKLQITTAGFDKKTLLGERYDKALRAPDVWKGPGVTIARDLDARALMIWRGAPDDADIEDPATWRLANPASWLDMDNMRLSFKEARENDFRRLHLNQWTKADGAWLPRGAWTRCARTGLVIPEGADVFAGVDIGITKDSAAVVTAWPHS